MKKMNMNALKLMNCKNFEILKFVTTVERRGIHSYSIRYLNECACVHFCV